jgi:hypothetical protein
MVPRSEFVTHVRAHHPELLPLLRQKRQSRGTDGNGRSKRASKPSKQLKLQVKSQKQAGKSFVGKPARLEQEVPNSIQSVRRAMRDAADKGERRAIVRKCFGRATKGRAPCKFCGRLTRTDERALHLHGRCPGNRSRRDVQAGKVLTKTENASPTSREGSRPANTANSLQSLLNRYRPLQ